MASVFASYLADIYTYRKVTVQFTSRIYGGIPLRPDVIEAWIRKGTGIGQKEELAAVMRRTLIETDPELADARDADGKPLSAYDLMKLASEKMAASQSSVGFKRDQDGLYIESRQIKAGLREATNILYAGERWGATKKGPKSWLAERVFVGPEKIHLTVPTLDGDYRPAQEPTNLDLFVGHVTGPQGPRSTLTYYQYVEQPRISFVVATVQDSVIIKEWPHLWSHLENLGFGALRSQDQGRFEVTEWEPCEAVPLSSLTPAWMAEAHPAEAVDLEAAVAQAAAAGAGNGRGRR